MGLMERSGVASAGGESHLSEWKNFSSLMKPSSQPTQA